MTPPNRTRLGRLLILLIALTVSVRISRSQTDTPLPGLSPDQVKAIVDTASGERALNHIRHLTLHHRWFVSDGYFDAAQYVLENAKAIGLQDVRIERFPSDGEIYYSTDRTRPKWTVRSARLSLVSPVPKHLVSWEENPIVLASNSRSADVVAELVDAGEGVSASDYEGKDVKGKLVLASSPQAEGRIDAVHRLAVLERGAAGVISYRSYYLDDFPDLVTWDHIWTLDLDGRPSTFGFCISKRIGWALKRLLEEGERVVLHAEVDAQLSAGEYGVVTGYIPGTDLAGQEIWFVAHLDHTRPSANDNASGSAAILEAAQTLTRLIDSGALPRPRRTIRFFWVPEINGTYAYISRHLEETRRAAAVINMDMVGENQGLCGSVFRVTRTPDSAPSFLSDLLSVALDFMLAHDVQPDRVLTDPYAVVSPLGSRDPWKAEVIPYSGGSDHYVFMGGVVNIPATMLGSWPDFYYHSSGDTPDKSDPTQLRRAVVYAVLVAATIAHMDTEAGLELLDPILAACLARMDEAAARARAVFEERGDLEEALNLVQWAHRRDARALESVATLLPGDRDLASRIESASGELEVRRKTLEASLRRLQAGPAAPPSEEERRARRLIPVRNPSFPGPIATDYLSEKLREPGLALHDPFTEIQRYELDAFIDGRLSVAEIRDAVSAECGSVPISAVLEYMSSLEKVGLISFKRVE